MSKKCDVSISFLSVNAPQSGVSAFPPQSSAQHSAESVQPKADKVAGYSPDEDRNDINPGDMEFSDMEKPTVSQVNAVKVQSDTHGSSSNEAKAPQAHAKPQSSSKDTGFTTNHLAQPVAPAEPVTLAQPATSAQPFALGRPVTPAQPGAPVQPVALAQPVAPAQPVTPAQPVAPVQPVMPDEPVEPAQPVAPAQPVSLPINTIESAVGQSNGFMPQSAPLTASYNPAVATSNSASMSRYFDSPSNSPNLLPQQPYYEPPKLQAPQQNFAPHPEPKKPGPQTPASDHEKPEVSPYSAFNVSSSVYILFPSKEERKLKLSLFVPGLLIVPEHGLKNDECFLKNKLYYVTALI